MPTLDTIAVPLTIPPEAIKAAVDQLKKALLQGSSEAQASILKGTTPIGLRNITGAEIFQEGKRTFQATGVVKQKVKKDIETGIEILVEEFSASVKEITADLRKQIVARSKKQGKAREAALKAQAQLEQQSRVPLESLEKSGIPLRKQIEAERKKVETTQTQAQRQARKNFQDEFAAAQAQLKFQMQQEQASRVPIQSLEKSGEQMRAQLDAEQKKKQTAQTKARQEARRSFLEDFDAAQAEVKHQINARKQSEQQKKQRAQNAAQVAKERQREFASTILTGASAGIGVLGQAGFPLLNIGFAAMSGGMVGAGVAAASTAIGELTRAINTLKEEGVAAAKQLGFVSTGFKLAEARMQALQAILGSGALAAQQAELEHRGRSLERMGPLSMVSAAAWQSISSSFRRMRDDILTPKGAFDLGARGIGPTFMNQLSQQLRESFLLFPQTLQESRRNMLIQMQQGTPGVENDPYQVFLRMQNAALDVTRQEEQRLNVERLKKIDDNIKALEANTRMWQNIFDTWKNVRGVLNPGLAF